MTVSLHVFLVSDGTGLSAETAARAALAQFPQLGGQVKLHRYTELPDPTALNGIVDDAAARGGAIVHTLARSAWAQALTDLAERAGVPQFDLLRAATSVIARATGLAPSEGAHPRRLDEAYFRRVEAIEWTVRHDDGREYASLGDADVVLTGVSRTSKTPLSIYLAGRGFKTANVPLVPAVTVPDELFSVGRERVFGLTIDASTLLEIRRNRVQQLGTRGGSYTDAEVVQGELSYADDVFRRGRFTVLDVTGRAVEETAAEIERLLERRAARR